LWIRSGSRKIYFTGNNIDIITRIFYSAITPPKGSEKRRISRAAQIPPKFDLAASMPVYKPLHESYENNSKKFLNLSSSHVPISVTMPVHQDSESDEEAVVSPRTNTSSPPQDSKNEVDAWYFLPDDVPSAPTSPLPTAVHGNTRAQSTKNNENKPVSPLSVSMGGEFGAAYGRHRAMTGPVMFQRTATNTSPVQNRKKRHSANFILERTTLVTTIVKMKQQVDILLSEFNNDLDAYLSR